jgi:hypothetical protein
LGEVIGNIFYARSQFPMINYQLPKAQFMNDFKNRNLIFLGEIDVD